MPKKTIVLVLLGAWLAACGPVQLVQAMDWPQFGWNVERSSAPPVSAGIASADLGSLVRQQVRIDGTVDSSAIYLQGVAIDGATHNAFFVTTTYGKTIAIDASTGSVLWEYTPPSYDALAGTYRITTATPVADPNRRYIYAAAPDGMVRKLAISDGRVVWATPITRLPSREKIASPLSFFNGRVIAATDGYIGDQPPYQGHVAIINAATGKIEHVWNSLCSNRHELIDPASCPQSDSGIWGRAGVVIDPATGDLYLATGNALWNGATDWGDSVVELSPNAKRILGNYTPTDTERLNLDDLDLGSTSPVLLGHGLVAQGGKDGLIRILNWSAMSGAAPHRGGASFTTRTPSGDLLFTAPAVRHDGAVTWLFAADNRATAAWTVAGTKLHRVWQSNHPGTSPVVADGMLFAYDPRGGLYIYAATTGRELAELPCGSGHWNSPIVVDGMIALPVGNANSHLTSGVLDIWRIEPAP